MKKISLFFILEHLVLKLEQVVGEYKLILIKYIYLVYIWSHILIKLLKEVKMLFGATKSKIDFFYFGQGYTELVLFLVKKV